LDNPLKQQPPRLAVDIRSENLLQLLFKSVTRENFPDVLSVMEMLSRAISVVSNSEASKNLSV
jgi:hypothetical protein